MERSPLPSPDARRPVRTVLGEIPYERLGITDAHNHVWIEPVPGADPAAPVLDQFEQIRDELKHYRAAGGESLLDCQPGGCGRNANQLVELSSACGRADHRLHRFSPAQILRPGALAVCSASSRRLREYFTGELNVGAGGNRPPARPDPGRVHQDRAGERLGRHAAAARWKGRPKRRSKAGRWWRSTPKKGRWPKKPSFTSKNTGCARSNWCCATWTSDRTPGCTSSWPNSALLLEYDTFYRPKYQPETKLWPLIEKMVAGGLSEQVALATDMAEAGMYQTIGDGPGLASLPGEIKSRLTQHGNSRKFDPADAGRQHRPAAGRVRLISIMERIMSDLPFTFTIPAPGAIPSRVDNHIQRRLSAMKGQFLDQDSL